MPGLEDPLRPSAKGRKLETPAGMRGNNKNK